MQRSGVIFLATIAFIESLAVVVHPTKANHAIFATHKRHVEVKEAKWQEPEQLVPADLSHTPTISNAFAIPLEVTTEEPTIQAEGDSDDENPSAVTSVDLNHSHRAETSERPKVAAEEPIVQADRDGDDEQNASTFTSVYSNLSQETSEGPKVESASLTVEQRLDRDGRILGAVSSRLLEAQDDLEKTEREVLGKSFDLASLKSFLGSHREILDVGDELQAEIATAAKKISLLDEKLRRVHEKEKISAAEHMQKIEALKEKLAAKVSERRILEGSIQREHELAKEDVSLGHTNEALQAEEVSQVPMQGDSGNASGSAEPPMGLDRPRIESLADKVAEAKALLAEKRKNVEALSVELRVQNSYTALCENKSVELKTQRKAEEVRQAALQEKEAIVERHRLEAITTQRAANDKLKDRLAKAKANVATIQSAIIATKERRNALDEEASLRLGEMRKQLGAERQKADSAAAELATRLRHKADMEATIHKTELEIEQLQTVILNGGLAELRRNNSALKKDLNQTHASLLQSQIELAQAQARIVSSNATIQTLRIDAENHAKNAQRAMQESLAQIAVVRQKDEEANKRAQETTMQAEAAVMIDCEALWDKEHPQIVKQIEKCASYELDLQISQAQVASLKQSLQSARS